VIASNKSTADASSTAIKQNRYNNDEEGDVCGVCERVLEQMNGMND
jgi:hypothetical protein